jgi:hypothetical protein
MAPINRHFRLESWLMVALLIAPIAVGILVAVVVPYVREQISIDSCLGSGGRYDYTTNICRFQAPQGAASAVGG